MRAWIVRIWISNRTVWDQVTDDEETSTCLRIILSAHE
jgi:hypothetical protein